MKILRAINAILYVVAITFGILDLATGNPIFKVLWTIFLGVGSLVLLIVSIIQLKQRKQKSDNKKD